MSHKKPAQKKQEPSTEQQPEQKTPEELEVRATETEGQFIEKKCPKCGAKLLGNKIGDEWCSNVQCNFGLMCESETTASGVEKPLQETGTIDNDGSHHEKHTQAAPTPMAAPAPSTEDRIAALERANIELEKRIDNHERYHFGRSAG